MEDSLNGQQKEISIKVSLSVHFLVHNLDSFVFIRYRSRIKQRKERKKAQNMCWHCSLILSFPSLPIYHDLLLQRPHVASCFWWEFINGTRILQSYSMLSGIESCLRKSPKVLNCMYPTLKPQRNEYYIHRFRHRYRYR